MTRVTSKKMINIRLNPALWDRAKAAAAERGVTLERWITEAIEASLARQRNGAVAGAGTVQAAADGGVASEGAPSQSDLAWRVAALEAAVDYLANAVGVGFPRLDAAPVPADEARR